MQLPIILNRRKVIILLRTVISALFLAAVFLFVDFEEASNYIDRISIKTLAVVLFMLMVQTIFVGLRTYFLLIAQGAKIGLDQAIHAFLMSSIANSVLLTMVGGAVVRVLALKSYGLSILSGTINLVIEKALVTLTLMATSIIGLLIVKPPVENIIWLILIAFPIVILLFFLAFYLLDKARNSLPDFRFFTSFIQQLHDELERVLTSKRIFFLSFSMGLIGILLLFGAYIVLALDISPSTNWTTLFSALPIVTFLSSLPISIGGWGIREGSLIVILSSYGVPNEVSVTIAVILGLLSLAALVTVISFNYMFGMLSSRKRSVE